MASDQIRAAVSEAGGALPIPLNLDRLRVFCEKWHVTELALFGSVLRPDFRHDSDVDFLVSFSDDAHIGLGIVRMQDELRALVGRNIDLVTRKGIERSRNWIRRRNILSNARAIYVR